MELVKEIDKNKFKEVLSELELAFSSISEEKGKLYYDHFSKLKVTDKNLEDAKTWLFNNKKTNFFPTIAEIVEAVEITIEQNRPRCKFCNTILYKNMIDEKLCFNCGKKIEDN